MHHRRRLSIWIRWLTLGPILAWTLLVGPSAVMASTHWRIVARSDNDLVRVLREAGAKVRRFTEAGSAIEAAPEGSGVLILADGYPNETTRLDPDVFQQARSKKVRLYVEYPSMVPELKFGSPRALATGYWGNILERTVVASDAFGESLRQGRILMIHDCHHLPVAVESSHLVVAQVAGYDTAVYGLPSTGVHPVLFEAPVGGILVATTKLSQFVTARYGPLDAWEPVWHMILQWVEPGAEIPALRWTPTVRPSFGREDELPRHVEREALRRGAEWYRRSGLLVHPEWQVRYDRESNQGPATPDWPDGHRAGPGMPKGSKVGDGRHGLLEGFRSKIYTDGSQSVLWWRRADNAGASAGALALAGSVLNRRDLTRIGSNLGDWLVGNTRLYGGDFADPKHPAFGLSGWNDVPRYYGESHGYHQLWGDDNARAWLGLLRTAAALGTDRYDERLTQQLLALTRLTSRNGFTVPSIHLPALASSGWESHFNSGHEDLSPHFQAYVQACLLWGANATGSPLLRERAIRGVRRLMEMYPQGWSATNDQFNQERARMLLPLAWLVRLEDTPEHRGWLRRVTLDLTGDMDPSGAILTKIRQGPTSNAAYGTAETTLIQANGDPNTDLLYTANFALVGLHEAAAATGEAVYRDMEDRLARFLCRIQVRSRTQPQFDGGWFRGFDYRRWEYWGSDADVGWSLYSMETGWISGEILSVLALRQMQTSVWDLTRSTEIPRHFRLWGERMFPEHLTAEF